MIAVQPWVLGAIVLLAGCGFISAITPSEEKEETTKDTPMVDEALLASSSAAAEYGCCGSDRIPSRRPLG